MKKEWKKKNGVWEYDGELYSHVARIKADKLLKSPELRGLFHPNEMVHYCDHLIYKEEIEPNSFLYFASVKNFHEENSACRPIPLRLLEFTTEQKQEIMKKKKFPKSAFEKMPSGIKDEKVFDTPFGVELDGDDEYLGAGSSYVF